MSDDQPSRREADARLEGLEQRISEVVVETRATSAEVRSIREMLITEPEASPLGRSLLKYAHDNRQMIRDNYTEYLRFVREEFGPLDDWWNQSKGAWKFVLGLATVLGIIGAFFGILSYFGARP